MQRKTIKRLPSDGAEGEGERWERLKSGGTNSVRGEWEWAVKGHTDPGPSNNLARSSHRNGVDQAERGQDRFGQNLTG